jgi:hypothetical protein
MTTDELIDLGHKAGTFFVTQFGVASATTEWLERFAALVAAAEREACAKLAESTICDTHLPTGVRIYGTRAAESIRARSNT